VLLLHGWDIPRNDSATSMCNLARNMSSWGYSVIVPRGNGNLPAWQQPLKADAWAVRNALAVQSYLPKGVRIALVGHSLGGGATLHVSENDAVPAFRAYVALHPATVVARKYSSIRGPILLTMGTDDHKYAVGGVSEKQIGLAYGAAQSPKAYLDVVGNQHIAPILREDNFGGLELVAMRTWLSCFLAKDDSPQSCPSFEVEFGKPVSCASGLKTCESSFGPASELVVAPAEYAAFRSDPMMRVTTNHTNQAASVDSSTSKSKGASRSGPEEYFDCRDARNVTSPHGEDWFVFNPAATSAVLLLHGWDIPRNDSATSMCNLARNMSSWGYSVIVPRGNGNLPAWQQPLKADAWAVRNALAVQSYLPKGVRIALVGHSLGGGATLHVSENDAVPAFRAYVALHPATVVARKYSSIRGPILLTMGTDDHKYAVGGVSEKQIGLAYGAAQSPKAYLDVVGNQHIAPILREDNFGGLELVAMRTWLACFLDVTSGKQSCPSFGTEFGKPGACSSGLKTCESSFGA